MRVFAGINLPDEAKGEVERLVAPYRNSVKGVKWVDSGNFHITLNFMGEVEDQRAGEIVSALEDSGRGYNPFEVELGKAGAFPTLKHPRVFWVGLKKGEDMVRGLHGRIENCLSELGIARSGKRFHPHVTIGRVKMTGRRSWDLFTGSGEIGINFRVEKFSLIKSTLLGSGPVYDIIEDITLVS